MAEKKTRFDREAKPTRNWVFAAQAPADPAERGRAYEQMRLGNVHRNNLVALERQRRESVQALMREHYPEIECWEALVSALKDDKESLYAAARRRGQRDGSRGKLAADEKERDGILKQQIRDAASILGVPQSDKRSGSGLRGAASGDEALLAAIRVVNEESHAQAIAYRASCGCHSGTYQLAEEAASAANKTASPRFVATRGDGRFGVQIGGGGLPVPRAFARQGVALSTELQIHQERNVRAENLWSVWVRTGSRDKKGVERKYGREPIWVRLNAHLHRDLPEDAVIQRCVVHRKRAGYSDYWQVRFVLSRDSWAKDGRASCGACGVNLNWRQFPDGSLRVATAIGDDGEKHELFVPSRMASRWPLVDHLKSIRDKHFDWVRVRLADWLDANHGSLPDWLVERAETLRAWKSPYRLMSLVRFWERNRFRGDDTIWPYNYLTRAKEIHHRAIRSFNGREPLPDWLSGKHPLPNLQDWAKVEKILCDHQVNLAFGSARQRKALYENFADMLGRRYKTVVLGKVDYRKLARNPTPADADGKVAAAKYNSRIAASGILHNTVKAFAANPVETAADNITKLCWRCGEVDDNFDATRHIVHVCSLCSGEMDQDESAARWLLRRLREGDGPITADSPDAGDSPGAITYPDGTCDDASITGNSDSVSRNGSHDSDGTYVNGSIEDHTDGQEKRQPLAGTVVSSDSKMG